MGPVVSVVAFFPNRGVIPFPPPLEPVAADRRIEAGERPPAQPCAPTGQRPPEGKATIGQGDHPIELSRTEFLLLELFLEHPRQVLERGTIFERVWGYDFGSTSNSLGVYMGYLRRKTEANGDPRLLHTVRGVGYRFAAE